MAKNPGSTIPETSICARMWLPAELRPAVAVAEAAATTVEVMAEVTAAAAASATAAVATEDKGKLR